MSLSTAQGQVLNRVGGGSGTGLLDTTYRASTVVAVRTIGRARFQVTVTKGGATDVRLRVMDYTDSSNPRVLQSVDTLTDGGASTGEHVYAADAVTDLLVNLEGSIEQLALEAKFTGSGNASSSAAASLWLVELPR